MARQNLISISALLALLAGVTPVASAEERAPAAIRLPEARLVAGECEAATLEPAPFEVELTGAVDVVISVDFTQGLAEIHAKLAEELPGICSGVRAALPGHDVRFALISHQDYEGRFSSCDYRDQVYGGAGVYPFRIEAALGASDAELVEALGGPGIANGFDTSESYGRVIWEVAQPDSGIGLRAGAQKLLLLMCDSSPHDCNLTEGIEPFDASTGDGCRLVMIDTGKDPGRDGVMETDDDIDFQNDALAALEREGIQLLAVYSGNSVLACYWRAWAERTGGEMMRVRFDGVTRDGASLGDSIAGMIVRHVPAEGEFEATMESGLDVSVELLDTKGEGGAARLRLTYSLAGELPVEGSRIEGRAVVTRGGIPVAWQPVVLSVGDAEPPTIAVRVEVIEPATATSPARLRLAMSASDACDPAPTIEARLGATIVETGAELELPPRLEGESDEALEARRALVLLARDAAGNESTERIVLDESGRE